MEYNQSHEGSASKIRRRDRPSLNLVALLLLIDKALKNFRSFHTN